MKSISTLQVSCRKLRSLLGQSRQVQPICLTSCRQFWTSPTSTSKKEQTRSGLLVRRFINPWIDAVSQRDPVILSERIDRYTEGFAVVSTLLCALSAAALANIPSQPQQHDKDCKSSSVLTSLLKGTGLFPLTPSAEAKILHDAYAIACSTSFFSAACALGLSTVLNVVGTVAPRIYVQSGLIIRHSLALGSIPLFATISGGCIGLALVIGIDMASCSPLLTYIALGQLSFTVSLVAGTALRAQIGLVRAITAADNRNNKQRRKIKGRQ
ncbi:expressed unknown protein [Seminavis robusta]|uniref:Transmembrane protein n=1 Tax=Seminavis robusta TaxID=568900 RepID=A0A9N8HZR9_9STRA|nr:expressed unknown protein [Seminavis robusta]|eukprot:Sro2362_g324900.1 n/a (269) ;mRNA; f:13986-14792